MPNAKPQYTVFIGRMQLFHNTHKAIMDYGLQNTEKLIVLFGSANRPRTFENPFTANERYLMVSSVYQYNDQILYNTLPDYADNLVWATKVRSTVDRIIELDGKDPDSVKINILVSKSDSSSFYLDMFPEWENTEVPKELLTPIHATELRESLFSEDTQKSLAKISKFVPPTIIPYLKEFQTTNHYYRLVNDFAYIKNYKKVWSKAPYPPTFVTTDAVVVQSGHVLLIQRKAEPGKGLWALPGGFLNQDEYIEDGMIRELREETKLKLQDVILRKAIREIKIVDTPKRSFRGRTITHAFYIVLRDGELPRVKGADDALHAKWVPLHEVKCEEMFEDHYFIIQGFTGI